MTHGVRPVEILILLAGSAIAELVFINYLPPALYFDLPLVLALYVGWNSDPVRGGIAGTLFGLLQDIVQLMPYWGLNGLSKTLVGFSGAYLSRWVVLEAIPARMLIISAVSAFNNLVLFGLWFLMAKTLPGNHWSRLAIEAVVTGVAGALLFRLYDRIKYPEKDFRKKH